VVQYTNPTLIYHFTHINNLRSLVNSGGLICKNGVTKNGMIYTNAAYTSVQERREQFQVPLPPYGVIHDYVPFYFNSHSPMLYAIKQERVTGIEMKSVIFFQTTAQEIKAAGKSFVFTDGHGIMALTDYYNDLKELHNVPWGVIHAKYWNDFPDGRRERQSEFMVQNTVEWNLIKKIGVYDKSMKDRVDQIMNNLANKPPVEIERNWYF